MPEPLRIMSLHALAYCERLFYLEELNAFRHHWNSHNAGHGADAPMMPKGVEHEIEPYYVAELNE